MYENSYVLLKRLQWTATTSIVSSRGTFSQFLSFATSFSVLPISFIVSGVSSSRFSLIFWFYFECISVLNFLDICLNWRFISQCFVLLDDTLEIILNIWYREREWDPSFDPNSSSHIGADIFELLFFDNLLFSLDKLFYAYKSKFFFILFPRFLDFVDFSKLSVAFYRFIWPSSALYSIIIPFKIPISKDRIILNFRKLNIFFAQYQYAFLT